MSRRFPSTPAPGSSLESMRVTLSAVRGAVTYITGQEQPQIQPLGSSATNAEVIAKINEIIARLQGSE